MENNIAKTIQESLEICKQKFWFHKRKPQEEEYADIKSHLLQSQIRLIDSVIEEMKSKKVDNETNEYYHGFAKLIDGGKAMDEFQRIYNLCLEEQISSLEEVKKLIENL